MRLFKTTIVIWTDYNPGEVELEDLAREAACGDAYCSKQETVLVDNAENDPELGDTEFFDKGAQFVDEEDGA